MSAYPWSDDRILLERYVIASSWSEASTARDLLKFPTSAWLRDSHRAIVDTVRGLLANGDEVNDIAIGMRLRQLHPEHWEEYQAVHNLFADDLCGLSSLQRFAVKQFRDEIDWTEARLILSDAAKEIRRSDFADWWNRHMQRVLSLAPDTEKTGVQSFDKVFLERIDARLEGVVEEGSRSMIPELDEHLGGGVKPGQMILIVGSPGMGKTTLGFQIAANLSAHDRAVLFNQLEMTAEEMADRAIAMALGKDLRAATRAELQKARKNARYLRNLHLFDEHVSLDEFKARTAAHLYRHRNTVCMVTDYAGLLQSHSAKTNAVNAANEVSQVAKELAKRHNVAHILLQQPSKQYLQDGKPSTSHIRDSGKFEQDAHAVLFIHYPHRFDSTMPRDYTQLHILKNRSGRSGGVVHLEWHPGSYTMRQWTDSLPMPNNDPVAKLRRNIDQTCEELDWTASLP